MEEQIAGKGQIVDFHTHTFPDKMAAAALEKLGNSFAIENCTDGTAGGLLSSMREAGIGRSVVLPVVTSPASTPKINDFAAAVNEKLGKRGYFSFGGIHPDYPDYRQELKRIQRLGLKGIKLHPAYQACNMDDIRYLRILEEAASLGLVVVYHAGIDGGLPEPVYADVKMALHVIDTIGYENIVLAHMGGWEQWQMAEQYLCGAKVYFDTAACIGFMEPRPSVPGAKRRRLMEQGQLSRMIRKHGPEHVLFGTDSPWTDQKKALELFETLDLTREEKRLVLGENARRLLQG